MEVTQVQKLLSQAYCSVCELEVEKVWLAKQSTSDYYANKFIAVFQCHEQEVRVDITPHTLEKTEWLRTIFGEEKINSENIYPEVKSFSFVEWLER